MTNGETQPEKISANFESLSMEEKCDQLNEAILLTESVERLLDFARHFTTQASMNYILSAEPFLVEIHNPTPDTFVSVDDDVVEQRVGHFIATEVTSIGSGGAEFYDRENDRRLSVRGYDFAVKSLELLKPEPTDAE